MAALPLIDFSSPDRASTAKTIRQVPSFSTLISAIFGRFLRFSP